MRRKGMGNLEIVRQLGGKFSYAIIANIASELIKKGKIERIKPGQKKKT